MDMKKNVRSLAAIVLALVLCAAVFAVPAFAEGACISGMEVEIALKGDAPSPAETFTVTLSADDAAFPMPEGSVDGVWTGSVQGAGKVLVPDIQFEKVGIYTYTVTQSGGNKDNGVYDKSVYHLTVTITNSEDGEGLEKTVAINKVGVETKCEALRFENQYRDTPKTGDESQTALWCAVMLLSFSAAAAMFFLTRKKGTREQ